MKKLMIMGCCLILAGMGCKGHTEQKTQHTSDQPFGVYQSGIDRAKEEQKKSVTRAASEDSVANEARDK